MTVLKGGQFDEFLTPVHRSAPRDLTGIELAGRYQLIEIIGGGGMGTVYRGLDRTHHRPVAVKVLDQRADFSLDPAYKERFEREAKVLQRLSHRCIVEVLDSGESAGVQYIVMEMLEGETLAVALEREPRFDPDRAVSIAKSICEGLQFAHELGLVHRDLKPANIMLGKGDVVKLLDFGLAKPVAANTGVNEAEVTKASVVMGSPTYMAPEQARGESIPASDIYSVGVILFRMLSGRLPFLGKASIDVIVQHLTTPLPWLREIDPSQTVPMELELVMRRCLEKDAVARYPSAAMLIGALDESKRRATTELPSLATQQVAKLGTLSIPAVSVPAPRPSMFNVPQVVAEAASTPARRSLLALFAGVAFVLLAAGVGVFVASSSRAAAVTPAAVPIPVAAPAVTTTPVVPEVVSSVTFRINSIPAGASLKLDKKMIGTTPHSFELPLDGSDEATAELTLEYPGYQSLTFIVTSPGPRFDLTQRLQKSSGAPSRANAAPPIVFRPDPQPRAASAPASEVKSRADREPSSAVGGGSALAKEMPSVREPEAMAPASGGSAALAPNVTESKPTTAVATPVANASGVVALDVVTSTPRMIDSGTAPRLNASAVAAKTEGTVVARCTVSSLGFLEGCRILKSLPFMDEAVLESLKTRRYEPAKVGTRAVATEMSVVVRVQKR
jgi:eukaryotic-like serine/threonine-protein kinase